MIYAHKRHDHTQEVGEWEAVKRRLLERSGWYAVESVEPEEQATPDDFLPADLPGLAALLEAGISTYSELQQIEDLTKIEGVGRATAAKIHAAIR